MTIRVAINGYGRIGRNILRAHYEGGKKHDIQIVAINDLGDPKTNAHLTQYDTAHGRFPGTVGVEGEYMVVNGDKIRVLANRNPAELPWGELKVDVVLECTGFFTSKEKADKSFYTWFETFNEFEHYQNAITWKLQKVEKEQIQLAEVLQTLNQIPYTLTEEELTA